MAPTSMVIELLYFLISDVYLHWHGWWCSESKHR